MAIVARLEAQVPSLNFFPIHGNIPIPQGTYETFDREACPFTVKSQTGDVFPTQWELVSSHADGSPAIVEVCASVTRSQIAASPGQRYVYDVHDEAYTYANGYNGNWQLLLRQLDRLKVRATDQYGNIYKADFANRLDCCPLLGVFPGSASLGENDSSNPQDNVLWYHRRGVALTTVEVPMMLRPTFEGNPDKLLSNFGHLSAFLTFSPAMSGMVGFDLSWSATVSGGTANPKAERQWHLFFESLELEHPTGFQLYTEHTEPWLGTTYSEGSYEVTPLVKPHYSQGVVSLSGDENEFIPAGTIYVHSPTGKQYETVFATFLNSSGQGSVQVHGFDPSGDASGDNSWDRNLGDILNRQVGIGTATCNDSIYNGLKQCLHMLPQRGERTWRFSLASPGADALFQAQRWSKRLCWAVAKDGTVGDTRLLSWQNPAAGGWYAQLHITPTFDHVPSLSQIIDSQLGSAQSNLAAQTTSNISGTGGPNMDGFINPTGSEQGGSTGTIDISPWAATQHLFDGNPDGLVYWEIHARCWRDRHRTQIVERDGTMCDMDAYGGANGFIIQQGIPSYYTSHWDWADVDYVAPTGTEIDGRHESDALSARRQPPSYLKLTRYSFESNNDVGISPLPPGYPYASFGGGYDVVFSSHMLRYTHGRKALAWLANDPIGKRQVLGEAEWRRVETPQSRWTSLLSGPESLGGNVGRADAWTMDIVSHGYALRQSTFGGGSDSAVRSWAETACTAIEHVQMPNGVWFRELSSKLTRDFPVGERRNAYYVGGNNYPFKEDGAAHPTLAAPGIPPTPGRIAGTGTFNTDVGDNLRGYLHFDVGGGFYNSPTGNPNSVPAGSVFSRVVNDEVLFYVTETQSQNDIIGGTPFVRAEARAFGSASPFPGANALDSPFTDSNAWRDLHDVHAPFSGTDLTITATGNQDPDGNPEYQFVKTFQDTNWLNQCIVNSQPISFDGTAIEVEVIVKAAPENPGTPGQWDTGEPAVDSTWIVSFWNGLPGTELDDRPGFVFRLNQNGTAAAYGFSGTTTVPSPAQYGTVTSLGDGWFSIKGSIAAPSTAQGTPILDSFFGGANPQDVAVGQNSFVCISVARRDVFPQVQAGTLPNPNQQGEERRLLISKVRVRNIGPSSLDATGRKYNIGWHDNATLAPEFSYVGQATFQGGDYTLPIDYSATVSDLVETRTIRWPGIIGGIESYPFGSPIGFRAWGTTQTDPVDTNPDAATHYRARAAVCRPNEIGYMLHGLRAAWKSILRGVSSVESTCKRLMKNGGRGLWRLCWMDSLGTAGTASGVAGGTWDHVIVRQYHNSDTNVPGRFSTNQNLGNPAVAAPDGSKPYFMQRVDAGMADNRLDFTQSGGHEAMGVASWHAVEDDQDELANWGSVTQLDDFAPGTADLADCLAVIRQGGPPGNTTLYTLEREFEFNDGNKLSEIRNTAGLLARIQQGLSPGTEE